MGIANGRTVLESGETLALVAVDDINLSTVDIPDVGCPLNIVLGGLPAHLLFASPGEAADVLGCPNTPWEGVAEVGFVGRREVLLVGGTDDVVGQQFVVRWVDCCLFGIAVEQVGWISL